MVVNKYINSNWQKIINDVFFAQSTNIAHHSHDYFCDVFYICSSQDAWSKEIKMDMWFQFWTTYACIETHDVLSMIMILLHVIDMNLEAWIIIIAFNNTCLYICSTMIHIT
jgi:hypothetical protein